MREPYERIAVGPYRDETHRATVQSAAADLTGAGMPQGSPETGSGQLSEGAAVSEWPKGRHRAQRVDSRTSLTAALDDPSDMLLEAIARHFCTKDGSDPDGSNGPDFGPHWQGYLSDAWRAINAVRVGLLARAGL